MRANHFSQLRLRKTLIATAISAFGTLASANPVDGVVIAGAATFESAGSTLTINQTSDRAIINWQGFSIGADELTRFNQPGASSAVLNRVLSANPSNLMGRLESNGQVFLINPNGILLGAGARIDTQSFIGSTLDLDNASFMKGGDFEFSGNSTAKIENYGKITANGGDVFLVGYSVKNAGTLEATGGTVGLAAGNVVLLQQAGDKRLYVKSSLPRGDGAGVDNDGTIKAAQVELAAAGGNVFGLAVNNSGSVHATGISERSGRIFLTNDSDSGRIHNSGSLIARKSNGDGGTVEITNGQNMEPVSTVTSSGLIDVFGDGGDGRGGKVLITADRIALLRGSRIDARGAAGGGLVLVGGGKQGKDPGIRNAQQVWLEPGALIDSSALVNGTGGTVITWGNDHNYFGGQILARGGSESGDGGFVETSSALLEAFGEVDASAPQGNPGEWLLDPFNVSIVGAGATANGAFNGASPNVFTPTADSATVLASQIVTALSAGTSVTITTAGAGTQAGNIDVLGDITGITGTSGNVPAKLTLNANGSITVSSKLGNDGVPAAVGTTPKEIDVDLIAGGSIVIAPTGEVRPRLANLTAGSNVTISGLIQHAASADFFGIGSINITAGSNVFFNGTGLIQTKNAPLTIRSSLDNVEFNNTSKITTNNATVTLTSNNGWFINRATAVPLEVLAGGTGRFRVYSFNGALFDKGNLTFPLFTTSGVTFVTANPNSTTSDPMPTSSVFYFRSLAGVPIPPAPTPTPTPTPATPTPAAPAPVAPTPGTTPATTGAFPAGTNLNNFTSEQLLLAAISGQTTQEENLRIFQLLTYRGDFNQDSEEEEFVPQLKTSSYRLASLDAFDVSGAGDYADRVAYQAAKGIDDIEQSQWNSFTPSSQNALNSVAPAFQGLSKITHRVVANIVNDYNNEGSSWAMTNANSYAYMPNGTMIATGDKVLLVSGNGVAQAAPDGGGFYVVDGMAYAMYRDGTYTGEPGVSLIGAAIVTKGSSNIYAGTDNKLAVGGINGSNTQLLSQGVNPAVVADLVGMDGATLVGMDGATMVAAGAGNIVAAGAGNLNVLASLIGMDGASLIGMDGATFTATLVGMDAATLKATLIGMDAATLIGMDHATLVGMDAATLKATLIGMDGASLKASLIGMDGASMVAAGGLNLEDAASMVAAGGLNLGDAASMVAAGGLNGKLGMLNAASPKNIGR